MARSMLVALTVAACSLLVVTDFSDAGCRHRRHRGGCGGGCGGGYSQGCGGGGCGQMYGGGGCGGMTACGGGGGCQGVPYNGQPIPDQGAGGNGNNPPPPPPDGSGAPSASLKTTNNVVIAAPQTYAPAYRTTNVTYRRGLFGRFR